MLIQILLFLLDAVLGFFTFALLARFALQWARAPFRNPVGQFVIAVTDWIVRPARRVIPSAWGLDLPSLILAWIAQGIYLGLAYGLSIGAAATANASGIIALLAVLEVIKIACHLAFGVLIVSIIFSWINPYAPLAPLFNTLAEPLLRPFRRLIPPIGGVDLSPMVPLLLIQVIQMLLAVARNSLLPGLLVGL
ncbi:MAG TPA: YggT family protein [Rhodocyclaceae bacterium]|nr:YggT family protein [Rhodocyclaceae bacterium]